MSKIPSKFRKLLFLAIIFLVYVFIYNQTSIALGIHIEQKYLHKNWNSKQYLYNTNNDEKPLTIFDSRYLEISSNNETEIKGKNYCEFTTNSFPEKSHCIITEKIQQPIIQSVNESLPKNCSLGDRSGIVGFTVGIIIMTLSWLTKMKTSYYISKEFESFDLHSYMRYMYTEDKIFYIYFVLGISYGFLLLKFQGILWFVVWLFLGLNFEMLFHYFIARLNINWNLKRDRTPNIILVDLLYAILIIAFSFLCIYKVSSFC